jgi:Holliday junction DNA helicase RuvB
MPIRQAHPLTHLSGRATPMPTPFDRRTFAESLGIRPTALPPPTDPPEDTEPPSTTQAQRVRPTDVQNMIGQWELRSQVLVKVRAATMRGELPNHFLFYGAPGLGKTTLAKIVAHELDAPLRVVEATAVDTPTKMANTLGELDSGTVLFIDEIHGLPRKAQEMLGLAMEDLQITVSVGTNRNNTTTQTIRIQPFVAVGATTLAGNLTGPLRDRFGFVGNLTFYEDEDLSQIIERASQLLPNKIHPDAAQELASRSRGTPRVALNLLSKVADYAVVSSGDQDTPISIEHVDEGLSLFDIDSWGMNPTDRKVLRSLCVDHMGGPVGLHRIAASTSVEQRTLADVIEPFLVRAGMLRNTSRGRVATPRAFGVFGLKVPPFLQRMDSTPT